MASFHTGCGRRDRERADKEKNIAGMATHATLNVGLLDPSPLDIEKISWLAGMPRWNGQTMALILSA